VYYTIQGDDRKLVAGLLGASSASLLGIVIICAIGFRIYWQERVQQAMIGTEEPLVIGTPVSPDLESRVAPYHVITAQF